MHPQPGRSRPPVRSDRRVKTRLLVMDTPEHLRSQLFGRKVVFHLRSTTPGMERTVGAMPFVHEAKAIDSKLVVTMDDPEAHNPDIIRCPGGLRRRCPVRGRAAPLAGRRIYAVDEE